MRAPCTLSSRCAMCLAFARSPMPLSAECKLPSFATVPLWPPSRPHTISAGVNLPAPVAFEIVGFKFDPSSSRSCCSAPL